MRSATTSRGSPFTGVDLNAPFDGHRAALPSAPAVDHELLARQLAENISGEVRFDTAARAAYSADASNYRQIPIGVVLPRNIEDILVTLDICREHGVPILPRGGGTSQNGQCVNIAVVVRGRGAGRPDEEGDEDGDENPQNVHATRRSLLDDTPSMPTRFTRCVSRSRRAV